jgi:hypothetical protein
MRRYLALVPVTTLGLVLLAGPASACGGLVAPNGAVQLQRTTTLAAYHDGVEHYVTSFQFAGGQSDFGSIIPLPGVPTDVRRAGSWTLQRLELETAPPVPRPPAVRSLAAALVAAPAQVLLQTKVDALDLTVLAGGGQAVVDWVRAHGYAVSPDAPAVLDFYARRSPVFLAARFDASAARAKGQLAGDGTPVQISIPTPNPWVPLHILGLAKGDIEPVEADVYLLTDRPPTLLGTGDGVRVQVSEPASSRLLDDLRRDRDTQWVPDQGWLTFLRVDAAAGRLVHDLAVDASGAGLPSPAQAGYQPVASAPPPEHAPLLPLQRRGAGNVAALAGLGAIGAVALGVAGTAFARSRRGRRLVPTGPDPSTLA